MQLFLLPVSSPRLFDAVFPFRAGETKTPFDFHFLLECHLQSVFKRPLHIRFKLETGLHRDTSRRLFHPRVYSASYSIYRGYT